MKLLDIFKKKPIKLCRDCKWFKKDSQFNRCYNPIMRVDIAEYARSDVYFVKGWCGKRAKYFEAK